MLGGETPPNICSQNMTTKKDTSIKNQNMKSTSENHAIYTTYTTRAICVLGVDEVEDEGSEERGKGRKLS